MKKVERWKDKSQKETNFIGPCSQTNLNTSNRSKQLVMES